MSDEFNLKNRLWWDYINEDLQELSLESVLLYNKAIGFDEKFHDYAFIVFPAAKAYEGYLKKIFLAKGFITEEDYSGKHFRIGKALNPSLDPKYRYESVYDKIIDYCGDKVLANNLWETWKNSRNLIFHWFPNEKNSLTISDAKDRLNLIFDAMDYLYKGCNIE